MIWYITEIIRQIDKQFGYTYKIIVVYVLQQILYYIYFFLFTPGTSTTLETKVPDVIISLELTMKPVY